MKTALGAINNTHAHLEAIIGKLQQQELLTTKEKGAILEVFSTEFARVGLMIDDEPNEYGKRLDEDIGILDFED